MSASWNGIPDDPKVDRWHWLQWSTSRPIPVRWWVYNLNGDAQWIDDGLHLFFSPNTEWRYLGPCLTPDEINALVEAKVKEASAGTNSWDGHTDRQSGAFDDYDSDQYKWR